MGQARPTSSLACAITRVRAAQALAESGEHVIVKRLVALQHRLLNGFFGDRQRNADISLPVGRRGQRGQLQRVEGGAQVAVGDAGDMQQRVVIRPDAHARQPALAVRKRRAQPPEHVFERQGIELKQAAAADNGGRHGNHRVFGG